MSAAEDNSDNANVNEPVNANGEYWEVGASICKGKVCAIIRRVSPNLVAITNRKGAIFGTQASLMGKGWRIKIRGAQPPKRGH